MKLHLPIGLRKALMAVFAALAVSPAMAATQGSVTIAEDTTVNNGLTMDGTDSNKIVSKDFSLLNKTLPGYVLGGTQPNVNANGYVKMSTEKGYNAIVGSVTGTVTFKLPWYLGGFTIPVGGGRPNVKAVGDVVMDGPANAVMLGSTIEGTNITLENSENQTTTIGTVTDGILGDFAKGSIDDNIKGIEGIFNIVQGSKLNATTGSVTLNTATDTAVNKLKANIIAGGQGNLSTLVNPLIEEKLGSGTLANFVTSAVNNSIKENDSGSSITAGTDINLLGGASVIVDTTLSDLLNFGTSKDFAALLAGGENNITTVTLKAGQNLNLDSIINMAYGARGGVELSAGTADGVVGAINATGALNVVGGKTTLTADNIIFDPKTAVSINKLVGELSTQLPENLSGSLPINDIKALAGKLGALANQNVNASIVAGGAQLKAEALTDVAEGVDAGGDIVLGGTAGIVVNTKLTDVLSALDTLQAEHEMLFAKEVLESSSETSLTASRDINVGAQLNVLHGGFAKDDETEKIVIGKNTLTITAGRDVTLHGAANLVSGNVQVNAGSRNDKGEITHEGDIHMQGYPLSPQLAGAVAGLANGYLQIEDPANSPVSGMIGKLTQKGSFNVVTGGATLNATGDIIMDDQPLDAVGKTGVINAVLDTQLTDVITAVINGEPSSILPTDKDVFKPTTTLTAGGDIDMLGRVNVVAGLRGDVEVTAGGDVNLQGNLSMVAGNAEVTGKTININTDEAKKYKMYVDSSELSILPDFAILDKIGDSIEGVAMNAAVVAGGADLTATTGDITTGGTVGLLMNTPVADAIKELNPLNPGKNPSELEIIQSLLQKGEATTLTATNGNINVGSQFNLMHGGNIEDAESALVLTAGKAVNVQGTANVVSGNVQVNAQDINMTGEVLPNGMSTAANALAGILADKMGVTEFSGVLGKLVQKGSVNMVTGGATLNADGDITMTAMPVDAKEKIGNINAVIDTEIVDVLQAMDGNFDSLVQGGGHTTTLTTEKGNINLEGRVNLVNGTYVKVDAGKDVNLQGNISMIGGATVNAGTLADAEAGIEEIKGDININTSEDKKYKMYIDSSDLGGMELPLDADTADKLANTGVNAAIVAGGAKLNATQDINIGGTAGLVVNTPATAVMDAVMTLMDNQQVSELLLAEGVLNAGVGTTLNADRDINLGADFNLLHGGNFSADGKNTLVLTAGNAVNVQGTGNVVSGNVQVNADTINMTGERLTGNMADLAGALADSLVGDLVGDIPGADIMLDKLVNKGSVNVVTGGATLTAKNGITMSGVHETGAINAVLDTELTDLLETVRTGESTGLVTGGYKPTTLIAENGDITMEGRLNLVNGGMVTLKAENGTVNLNGSLSFIGGDATVTAQNIKLNDDETGKYQMYFDSEELGAILPAGSPITELLDKTGITDLLGTTGVNGAIVAGGAQLKAEALETESGEKIGGDITTGGTVSMLVNTPLSDVMTELQSYLGHKQEVYLVDQLLRKGTATTVHADGNINLASRLNVLHGGNMGKADDALKLTAGNDIKMNGTLNMVSGNVTMDADSINMTGEALKYDLGDGLAGMQGAEVLDKLATYGSANVVLGGATLTATGEEGITMKGLANAVLDVELVDATESFMNRPDMSALMNGGEYETTLHATTGDINLLGRLNVVNGGKVSLLADAGDVNLQGSISMISGGAYVKGQNIYLNTDTDNNYKTYISADELGYIVPAGSPYMQLLNQLGVTDKLGHTGINGAVVAGGAQLVAVDSITTGGTASIFVNTPVSEVGNRLMSLLTDPNHLDEIWMVKELLQKGVATTVTSTNGNIELGSRLNVLYGGGFTNVADENALTLNAANGTVKLDGTINMVSGNVQVNANNIELKGNKNVSLNLTPLVSKVLGNSEYAGLVTGSGMLDKVADKGINANVVMGGATLKATGTGENDGNIKLNGMANFVLDTQLENVVDAIIETNPQFVVDGGDKLTYLKADGNIDLTGRLNVVNGAYVKLEAGKDVNINGTLNMVSGKAKVSGANINLNGQDNLGLNWGEIIPGDIGNYADGTGLTDKLNKGVNGNLVLGGSELTASNDIKMTGMASVVTNVPLGSAFEALNKKMDETWQPELWLMKDMLDDGIATKLTAENGNIEMTSRLNMLHGGNFGENGANALSLTAGKEVIIAGTANIISGNTQVTAGEGIQITGKTGVGFDWDKVVDVLPDKYDGYGELAGQMGILDKLSKGVNGSVIAGGATLTANDGDITMEGMATAVVDVTLNNVIEAVEKQIGTPIMEGGTHATTITAAQGNINMNSRLNLVNGGQVTLDAGQNVNMNGTFNTVSGNATVVAGADIVMNSQNKVGVDISPVLNGGGHYADIATELGMADMLKDGVSSNIVAGGAYLEAAGNVKMIGDATAIVDTTASNVIGAVKGDNLGELMKGGRDQTQVIAKNGNIELKSQMNLVNGGNTENAGGVLLHAENGDVVVGGQISVVNRAEIKAGNEVKFNSGNTVLKYSDIAAGKVAFTGKTAEITDVKFNNASVDVLGTQLVNTLGSDVLDIGHLNVAEMGSIENLGSLTVQEATLSGATLYNAGSIMVSDKLTLDSATLSFVADENNVTLNHTAIVLGDGFQTLVDGSGDMLAGLHFELNYGALDIADDSNVFNFKLALFEGITEAQTGLLDADLADGEFSITLTNGFRVDGYENVNIVWENNVAYVKGSASVPEPTTATLSLLALAALAARRRRRK